MRWPILEVVAVDHLTAELPVRVATEIPANVDTLDGFVRVTRGPGSDDGVTDSPMLDIEAFAPTQLEAAELAEDCRQAIHALRGQVAGGSLVDTVRTATGPTRAYYSEHVERYVASYVLDLRRS